MSIIISARRVHFLNGPAVERGEKGVHQIAQKIKNVPGPHGGDETQEKGRQGQGLKLSLKLWDPAQKEGYNRIGARR